MLFTFQFAKLMTTVHLQTQIACVQVNKHLMNSILIIFKLFRLLIDVKYFYCIIVYLLGYSYKEDTWPASGSVELGHFDSLEEAIEGCNQDSRCDFIRDFHCLLPRTCT